MERSIPPPPWPPRYRGLAEGTGVAFAPMGADDVFEEVFNRAHIWTAQKDCKRRGATTVAAMNASVFPHCAKRTLQKTRRWFRLSLTARRLAEIVEGFTKHHRESVAGSDFLRLVAAGLFCVFHSTSWPSWLKVPLVRAASALARTLSLARTSTRLWHAKANDARNGCFQIGSLSAPRDLRFFRWFAPPAADWPAQGACSVDFPLNDAQTPMPEQLAACGFQSAAGTR